MYFIGVLLLGIWLGYKLRSLIEMLNYLKVKNYVNILVDRYEDSNYQVIRKPIKKKKVRIVDSDELEEVVE